MVRTRKRLELEAGGLAAMKEELIKKMLEISQEEQGYLDGSVLVNKELYTSENKF